MYILVFVLFLALSFILVTLGLFRPEHSELSLIGFVFIFLLSFIVIGGHLEVIGGTSTNSTFFYTTSENSTLLNSISEITENIYIPLSLEGSLAHSIGYWLAVISMVGFIGVILGLRHSKGYI